MKLPPKAMGALLCVAGVFAILLLKAGFIFLLLALLPTIAAYYIDHAAGKPVFKIVFAWNFAATMPSLLPLLHAGIGMNPHGMAELMANMRTWLFIYGGAAAGWCLIYLCRFIAHLVVAVTYEYHYNSLERLQKRLIDEWGQQIREKNG